MKRWNLSLRSESNSKTKLKRVVLITSSITIVIGIVLGGTYIYKQGQINKKRNEALINQPVESDEKKEEVENKETPTPDEKVDETLTSTDESPVDDGPPVKEEQHEINKESTKKEIKEDKSSMNKSDDTQKGKTNQPDNNQIQKNENDYSISEKKPETKPNAHEEKDIHEGSNDKSSVKDEPNTQPVPNEKKPETNKPKEKENSKEQEKPKEKPKEKEPTGPLIKIESIGKIGESEVTDGGTLFKGE